MTGSSGPATKRPWPLKRLRPIKPLRRLSGESGAGPRARNTGAGAGAARFHGDVGELHPIGRNRHSGGYRRYALDRGGRRLPRLVQGPGRVPRA